MSIKIEVVDSFEGFRGLERDWDRIYTENQEASIFLSWDWMITWWEVYSNSINTSLFIICVLEEGELIGIAPFHLLNSFPKSLIQGKTLTFIGSGESSKDKIVSQYSDFLVKTNRNNVVIKAISEFLISNKAKWDFADFEFLLSDSLVSKCFVKDQTEIHVNTQQYGSRFYISGIQSFDDFLDKMGNRWSKMYLKKDRKLLKQGKIEIESPKDNESVQIAFDELARMHEARWKNRTEFNIFKSALFNEFHTKILERLVPKDKVFIKTLTLNGNPLSSYFCFKDKSQIHYYQSGFYSKNANKFSPLFLLVCKEIGVAIKNNNLFDFMFDEDASSYKQEQYAAQSEPMYRLMWTHKKTRMNVYNYAKKIQSKYLKIKHSLNPIKKSK